MTELFLKNGNAELRSIFEAHHVNGLVPFEDDTTMYYGQLPAVG